MNMFAVALLEAALRGIMSSGGEDKIVSSFRKVAKRLNDKVESTPTQADDIGKEALRKGFLAAAEELGVDKQEQPPAA